MNSNSINDICNITLVILGIYLGILVVKAKNTGAVNDALLWDRTKTFDQCRDKEGYISYLYPRGLICAALVAGAGVLGFILEALNVSDWSAYFIILGVTMFTIIFYVYIIRKAMNTYY
ncbi:MAG: hypothetical protein ACOYBC_00670 [Bilifractor sp.]